MTDVTTIPVLPCISVVETIDFYRALGFEVIHEQTSPNVYLALLREGANLHFAKIKGIDPAKAFSTCLVIVPEVEELHAAFVDGIRRVYGKLLVAGIPRISRMKKGQSRFTVVDPAGNSVIFIRRDAEDEREVPSSRRSRLAAAIETATTLRDMKNDDEAAAKVLDVALARKEPCAPLDRARALAARAEIAIALGDAAHAAARREELRSLALSDSDRELFAEELAAADRLEHELRQRP